MRVTENPEIGVFVRTSNASWFFVQPDRGGGAVVTGAVNHARIHVFAVRAQLPVGKRPKAAVPHRRVRFECRAS